MSIYTEAGGASASLLTFSKLPLRVLKDAVRSFEGIMQHKDYMFVLCHLPKEVLVVEQVGRIARKCWKGNEALVLRLIHHLQDPALCCEFRGECMDVLVNGPFEIQRYAAKILSLIPQHVVETILTADALLTMPPTYACMLLEMTSGWFLQKHALLIIELCIANPFVHSCINVLKLVPCLENREKVVSWLEMYADQGVPGHFLISIWRKLGEYDRVDELSFARKL